MTLDDAAKIAMGWVWQSRVERMAKLQADIDEAIAITKTIESQLVDKTEQARSCVDDLLLALDLGFAQIEQATTLVDAQRIAGHLRDALKEGWG